MHEEMEVRADGKQTHRGRANGGHVDVLDALFLLNLRIDSGSSGGSSSGGVDLLFGLRRTV